MRTFDLIRIEDVSGISGTGRIAQGVRFDDGTCAMRWLTFNRSTAFYDSVESLEAIHGHGGKTEVRWLGTFARAISDFSQDYCENCPFASTGGLDKRADMVAPKYIIREEREEYLAGYRHAARVALGDNWATCSFGWGPALVIDGPKADPAIRRGNRVRKCLADGTVLFTGHVIAVSGDGLECTVWNETAGCEETYASDLVEAVEPPPEVPAEEVWPSPEEPTP